MGVPTSEVGYTPAMPKREDHEVHKRKCGGTEGGESVNNIQSSDFRKINEPQSTTAISLNIIYAFLISMLIFQPPKMRLLWLYLSNTWQQHCQILP